MNILGQLTALRADEQRVSADRARAFRIVPGSITDRVLTYMRTQTEPRTIREIQLACGIKTGQNTRSAVKRLVDNGFLHYHGLRHEGSTSSQIYSAEH